MNRYSAYGLTIASNRPLRGLRATDRGPVDATIRFEPGDPEVDHAARPTRSTDGWRAIRRTDDGGRLFLLASHGGTRAWSMRVSPEGTGIAVRRQGDVDPEDVAALVQSTGLPALLALRGVPLLHACAVAVGERSAILVLGGSGTGKSTVAAAAIARGAALVSDDVAALSPAEDGIDVLPGLAQLRLNPDTALALGLASRTRRLFAEEAAADRRVLDLSAGAGLCAEPRRVAAAYVLAARRSAEARIEPVEPSGALPLLLRSTHAGYATDRATRAAQLPFWLRLAEEIPVSTVHPADDLAAAERLVDELVAAARRRDHDA